MWLSNPVMGWAGAADLGGKGGSKKETATDDMPGGSEELWSSEQAPEGKGKGDRPGRRKGILLKKAPSRGVDAISAEYKRSKISKVRNPCTAGVYSTQGSQKGGKKSTTRQKKKGQHTQNWERKAC